MVKILITVCFPATKIDWYRDNPKRWKEEEKEMEIEINRIVPYKWGARKGLRVQYDNCTAWVFTEKEIIFLQ